MNGLLSGMVASCSGCNVYAPWASIPVGALGAFAFNFQNYLFEYVFHIDDPLGASAIHMGAGLVGVLSVGFFASSEFTEGDAVGVFYGGSGKQLLWQLADVLTNFTWSFVTVGAVFMALRMAGMLRVSEEVELMGMDVEEHGGPAYRRSSVFVDSTYPAELGKLIESDANTEIKEKTNNDECDQFDAPVFAPDVPLVRVIGRDKELMLNVGIVLHCHVLRLTKSHFDGRMG